MRIAASMAQNPIALFLERVRPQASRISISQGWKRIFGKAGLVELLKALAKISIVISVCAFILKVETGRIVNSMLLPAGSIPGFVLELCTKLFVGVMLASLVIVIADYAWSHHKWLFDLRMTKQEVKDEIKQADGDPTRPRDPVFLQSELREDEPMERKLRHLLKAAGFAEGDPDSFGSAT